MVRLPQGLLPVARRALLYGTSDTRPRIVLLPVEEEWDAACGAPPYAEDFNVSCWFPNDTLEVVPIHQFPGTSLFLENGFNFFITAPLQPSKGAGRPPINQTLQRLFSVEWRGNVIIMKRSSRDGRAIHITRPETSLINVVLQRSVLS
ncbi:hypothetical protein LXA43DRAFT_899660 [Ganoderma leucocontextum]|nr:hypothetical protein LXA43DRAFT_899660 [Ganoderma leucocontextum]